MDEPMIKLYQAIWCPYCQPVRMTLKELGITYLTVNVPFLKALRKELFSVSGQRGIPTLVHGDVVIADDDEAIIVYLNERYGQGFSKAPKK